MAEEEKRNCWSCAYRGKVAGSAHSRCTFAWQKSDLVPPPGDPHGISHGWYMFPLNYDPTWMRGECPAWAEERDPEVTQEKYSPLVELMGILGPARFK